MSFLAKPISSAFLPRQLSVDFAAAPETLPSHYPISDLLASLTTRAESLPARRRNKDETTLYAGRGPALVRIVEEGWLSSSIYDTGQCEEDAVISLTVPSERLTDTPMTIANGLWQCGCLPPEHQPRPLACHVAHDSTPCQTHLCLAVGNSSG